MTHEPETGTRSSRDYWPWSAICGALLAVAPACLWAHSSSAVPSQPGQAGAIFAKQCAGCHGTDAGGTEQGPPLAGDTRLQRRSVAWLRNVIHNGIPAGGMPAFDLPAADLNALAALVHSLNSPAAESPVPGDRGAGEQFFFGAGKCASCHMIDGRGTAVGPDLSNVARELTVVGIRTALLEPSRHITPGYQLVTVRLRNGETVRGFARSQSNFEIVIQDLKGQFYPVEASDVSSIQEETRSLMPVVVASPDELQSLIAYLSGLTGVQPGIAGAPEPAEAGGASFSNILHPRPGDWPTYNGGLDGNRYSELSQINTRNVDRLVLKWIFTVPLWKQFLPDTAYFIQNMQYFGLEVTPIVVGGIMYITGPHEAFALDARTGREIWEYTRPRTPGLVGDASLGTNRGVAILGDRVFMVTDDAHLVALNRVTGHLAWEVVMPDEPMRYGSTVAPLAVNDEVIAGVSGGDWGIRGFVAAYRAADGERLWRRWTIPSQGEPGAETWGKNPPADGGGATWLTGSYDPETNTLFWATGNPYPDSDDRARPGDNLYTDCILALDPTTGKVKWFYQVNPHDVHDWDANAPLMLVDTKYEGRPRKLLLHADKNGFFYVLDRTNGQVLLAKNFVRVTWARGIGADGRPQPLPSEGLVCPEVGTNWGATAFDPATRLFYVMAWEKCRVKLSAGSWRVAHSEKESGEKYLRALDIDSGRIVWQTPELGPAEGKREAGVLATAGGILFYGDPSGDIVAADARSGRPLWHFPTNGENKASPMTYEVDGKQFIALAVGPNILCFGLP